MGDIFDQIAASPSQGDIFDQVGGKSSVESPIPPPGVPRPSINVQRIDPIGNRPEADVQADLVHNRPWNVAARGLQQASQDAYTLTRSGYQAAVKGITGKAYLGEPADTHQLIQAGANMAAMMAGGTEGVPPTARLNQMLNSGGPSASPAIPLSDPGFSIARKLAREIPGVGGYLRKADLFRDIMNRVQGQPQVQTPSPGTLPPEAPPIVQQGWAMQRGGMPAPAAESGEALGSLNVPRGTQVVNNASGESSASMEAINRAASEKAAQLQRVVVDTRNGQSRPLIGADAVDYKPQPYESVEFRGGGRDGEIIDQGAKARPYKVTDVPIPQAKAIQPPFPGPQEYNVTRGVDPFTHPDAPGKWQFDHDYSSNVKQYGYRPDSQTLSVMYKRGSVYQFKVTPQMYAEMQKAPSAGGYLHDVIEPAQARGVGRHVGTVEPKSTPGAQVRKALGGKPSLN